MWDQDEKRDVPAVVEVIAHRMCTDHAHFLHADHDWYENLVVFSDGRREWQSLVTLSQDFKSVELLTAYKMRLSSRWGVSRGHVGEWCI